MMKNRSSDKDTFKQNEAKEFNEVIKDGYKTLVGATKKSNDLPKGRDYDFYKTHPNFTSVINEEGTRLINLMNKILRHNEIEGNMKAGDLERKTDLLGETNDVILDRAATTIDDLTGLRSLPPEPVIQTVSATIPINGSWNRISKITINKDTNSANVTAGKSIHLLAANNIVRPQKFFKDKIDNSNNPWMPRITDKPNSLKPLAIYIEPSEDEGGLDEFCHPYEYELDRFDVPEEFLTVNEHVEKPRPTSETPLIEVHTEEKLASLLEDLRSCKVFAVDLEHHSYRTFQGFTCLMQISTQNTDYLIDTLALRDKLYVLNEVFTKPSILKVFHGADSDISWLQRDLCLYVVNMFDTHRAAKLLNYTHRSLAYLLQRFCNFAADKKFQLADWRIRPLPQNLKDYAREDTHYLIYIYEMIKGELAKQGNEDGNLLEAVFQESKEVCKIKYKKPRLTEDSHLALYRRRNVSFDNRQMYALKEIYAWRDQIARAEDESTGYVLPNHMMLQVSEALPREVQGIFACCNPIPPLVRAYSYELHAIILKAREQPLQKVLNPNANRRFVSKESVKINIDSPLHCPHDLTKRHEFRDDLPTLLGSIDDKVIDINKKLIIEKEHLSFSLFKEKGFENKRITSEVSNLKFLGPYERYKLATPFINDEEEKRKDTEVDPPVSDRIDSLHDHLVKEIKKFVGQKKDSNEDQAPQAKPNEEGNSFYYLRDPLIKMAGGRKRKRSERTQQEEPYENRSSLHTAEPRVSLPPPPNKRFRKRRRPGRNESKQQDQGNNQQQGIKQEQGNKQGQGKRYNEREGNFNETQSNYNRKMSNSDQRGNNYNQKASNYNQKASNYNQRGSNYNQKSMNYNEQSAQQGNFFIKPQETNHGKGQQQQQQFQPFDYSTVNLSQFSGGGKKVEQNNVKTTFKGKGNTSRSTPKGRGAQQNNRTLTYRNRGGKSTNKFKRL